MNFAKIAKKLRKEHPIVIDLQARQRCKTCRVPLADCETHALLNRYEQLEAAVAAVMDCEHIQTAREYLQGLTPPSGETVGSPTARVPRKSRPASDGPGA